MRIYRLVTPHINGPSKRNLKSSSRIVVVFSSNTIVPKASSSYLVDRLYPVNTRIPLYFTLTWHHRGSVSMRLGLYVTNNPVGYHCHKKWGLRSNRAIVFPSAGAVVADGHWIML